MTKKWTVKDVLEAFEKVMKNEPAKPEEGQFTNIAKKIKELAERNRRVNA